MIERLRICWLPDLTPYEFIQKWQGSTLNERQSYQAHFADLCALVGVEPPSPASADSYCFERGVAKTGSRHGWADVWRRGCFAFEYKAPDRNLDVALKQLMTYALALENPPLLVVCDTQILQIHTHFTNAPSEVHTILLQDIGLPANLDKLRWLFTDPDKFHPQRTIAQITEQAAGKFADLAQSLNSRNYPPQQVAHFLNQCLFCLFAEDAGLLPGKMFERLLEKSQHESAKLSTRLAALFASMQNGGDFGADDIAWFNGGLFATVEVLPLIDSEIASLHAAAKLDWSDIEPSIFGTLFERGLDPKKRAQLGAHYTDQQSIMRIINPVIVEPLAAEWQVAKAIISDNMELFEKGGKGSKNALPLAQGAFIAFLERLKNFKVLDPACGSGNFLYLALRALKDLEHKANLEAEMMGLQRQISIEVSPANVLGIEINPYATELARVTVWIGEIQWMLKNGYPIRKNPILQSLDHIENRDALLAPSPSQGEGWDGGGVVESQWPTVDVIVGNPPFLGDKRMRAELGDDYTEELRHCFDGRVPGGADLVTYWFEKARAQIEAGLCQRAGLVATNSIRQKGNRPVLERICDSTHIFNAWSDQEWISDGAAVRISLVCFGNVANTTLDGTVVAAIHADLTAGDNMTEALPLKENAGCSYFGLCLAGAFKVPSATALAWLKLPNPHGKPNSDVLKPIYNGTDISNRCSGDWVIDFALLDEQQAALYEAPFAYIEQHVKPVRANNREVSRAEKWWRHGRPRPELRSKLAGLSRYIVTVETAKHRLFVWLPITVAPEHKLIVFPRDDDTALGIFSSRFHVVWALAQGGTLGGTPVYSSTRCFETFPFPVGWADSAHAETHVNMEIGGQNLPTLPEAVAGIAAAAQALNTLRNNWLNPSEWVEWTRTAEEEKAGLPLRAVAKTQSDPHPNCPLASLSPSEGGGTNVKSNLSYAAELKKRTLTNLYNARPAWLDNAHKTLDAAVARAYGWHDYAPEMPDEEILRRLLALNLARS